jgi:hypothetical protein
VRFPILLDFRQDPAAPHVGFTLKTLNLIQNRANILDKYGFLTGYFIIFLHIFARFNKPQQPIHNRRRFIIDTAHTHHGLELRIIVIAGNAGSKQNINGVGVGLTILGTADLLQPIAGNLKPRYLLGHHDHKVGSSSICNVFVWSRDLMILRFGIF